MASTSETGHAKNVAIFEEIISFSKGLGNKYNPSKANIKIPALELLHKNAKAALDNAKKTGVTFNNATNARAALFKNFNTFSTQLLASASVFLAKEAIKDIKAINRKIQGSRSSKPPKKQEDGQPMPADKTISTSQQSYDSLIDHMEKMIETLGSHADYKPNEPELTIDGLKEKLAGMRQANSGVTEAYTGWSNARIQRNEALYNVLTGLLASASDIKNYVKGTFGFKSPQFKQLSAIRFSHPKL
jgi:hypothetical protein